VTPALPEVGGDVLAHLDGGVLHIALNRPERLNALVRPMFDALETLVRWAAAEPSVRALLLSGNGRAFSAGDDMNGLGDLLGISASDLTEVFDAYVRPVSALLRIRKPVVAALHGPVIGAAVEVALACDLRVADDTTVIGPIYAGHGLAAGTSLLPLYVGVPTARRLLMLAEPLAIDAAVAHGLVDVRVEAGRSLDAARELAERLAAGPTLAYGMIKSALLTGVGRGLLENLHVEEEISLLTTRSEDGGEGVRAFFEKREPRYRGV
jgi:2-(1,2-epoxy-1,2-dihydrophenyl)acetyl-CoA isomerase